MCVRLNNRASRINERAFAGPFCLTQCAPENADDCASDRSSLQAATITALRGRDGLRECSCPPGSHSMMRTVARLSGTGVGFVVPGAGGRAETMETWLQFPDRRFQSSATAIGR